MLCASECFKLEMIVDYLQHTLNQSFATIAKNIGISGCRNESKERNLRRYRKGEVAIPKRIKSNLIEYYSLNPDVFELGAITNQPKNNPDCFKKIKKKYKNDAYSTGQLSYIHNQVFTETLGSEEFRRFCKSINIPLGYFANIANPVNMRYSIDIIKEMTNKDNISLHALEQRFYQACQASLLVKRNSAFPTAEMNPAERIKQTKEGIAAIEKFEQNSCYTIFDADQNGKWLDLAFRLDENSHKSGHSNYRLFHETGRGYIPCCHSVDLGLSFIQATVVAKVAGTFSARFRIIQGGSTCIVRLH